MDHIDRNRLTEAWIIFTKANEESQDYENNLWAAQKLWELNEENPELCWELILEILERDSSVRIIGNLAAGPLEDLLSCHGFNFIERIEKRAIKDARFRTMLGGVWQNDIPEEIWKRVKTAAGESW